MHVKVVSVDKGYRLCFGLDLWIMWKHILIIDVHKNNMASEQLTLARLSSSVVVSLFSTDIALLLGEDFSFKPST